MQLSIFAVVATLATIVATSPMVESSPASVIRRRAINKAYFTEAELADQNPETCCCCPSKPPSEITDEDHLDKLIAASD